MSYQLVVGSQARILYSDQQGRVAISLALNELVRQGKLSGPIVISRDHHDVSGTDSPFRETSNVYDGSAFTAGKENFFDLVIKSFYIFINTIKYERIKTWLCKIVLAMAYEVPRGLHCTMVVALDGAK